MSSSCLSFLMEASNYRTRIVVFRNMYNGKLMNVYHMVEYKFKIFFSFFFGGGMLVLRTVGLAVTRIVNLKRASSFVH